MTSVLVLCDDFWHPAEVVQLGMEALKGEEFHFVYVKAAKDILTPERIAQFPVIFCAKGNNFIGSNTNSWFDEGVSEVMPSDFEAYVKAGGGFVSFHSSNSCKPGDFVSQFLGTYFVNHPPRCRVDITITGEHPITKGVGDFSIRDEHYVNEITATDYTELFHAYSEPGGDQIGGFAREIGEGRLCVLMPGHTVDVFYNREYQKIIRNSINWCMKRI